jgi:site-specific DNA recombinase
MAAPKIAASYGRTSQESDDGFSVASQLDANREYAARNGFVLPKEQEFSETFTGKVEDRPEMNRVRALVRARKIQVLIVYAADRFARSVGVGERLLNELFRFGVELHIVAWNSHVRNTPEDWMRFNFEQTFGDYERRKIVERTQRGKRKKSSNGRVVGVGYARYGFEKTPDKQSLVHHPEQAKVMRDIFTWLVRDGLSVAEIERRLTVSQIPSPGDGHIADMFERLEKRRADGMIDEAEYQERLTRLQNLKKRKGWAKHTLYDLLRDEVYCGVYYQNKYRIDERTDDEIRDIIAKSPDSNKRVREKKKVTRPRDEWQAIAVEPIVSREVWQEAQRRLDEGKRMAERKHTKQEYLMSGRLRCSCGHTRTGSYLDLSKYNKRSQKYYECSSRKSASGKCDQPLFRVDQVDAEAWEFVKFLIIYPQSAHEEIMKQQEANEQANAQIEEEMTHLNALIEQAQGRLGRVLDKLDEAEERNDRDEAAHYGARRDELKSLLADHRAQLDRLRRKVAVSSISLEAITSLADLDETDRQFLQQDDVPFAVRREWISDLGVRGVTGIEDGRKFVEFSLDNFKRRRWLGDNSGSS